MIFADAWFDFNGRRSTEYGIIAEKLPDIIKAEKQVTVFSVPGRSGSLFRDEGAYKNVTKSVECGLLSGKYIDKIAAWLDGAGTVAFSSEPGKAYDAFVKNQISFTKVWGAGFKRFIVQFDCQPFKKSVSEAEEGFTLYAPGSFMGNGSVPSAPLFSVYGSGDISLTVNGGTVSLRGIDAAVILDSEFMECYWGSVRLNNKMTGEFPELLPGANSISWSGAVERLEVLPRWRWL